MAQLTILGALQIYGILGLGSIFFSFSFAALGVYRLFIQVSYWLREAVWIADPLTSEIPPPRTGLKGLDMIAFKILDALSVASSALLAAFGFFLLMLYFVDKQGTENAERVRRRQAKNECG